MEAFSLQNTATSPEELVEQAWQLRQINRTECLNLSLELLGQDGLTSTQRAKALICCASVYAREGRLALGLTNTYEAEAILEQTPDLLWQARLQIALYSNHLRGDRVAAMSCATEIIRLAKQLKDQELECTGLQNLAILQAEFGLDLADNTFDQARQLAEATDQKEHLALIYYNWGWQGREVRKRDERVESLLQNAVHFAAQAQVDDIHVLSLCELGLLRLEQGDIGQSLELFNEALEIARERVPVELPAVFFYLGCYHIDLGQPQTALEYLLQSFALLSEADPELTYQVHKHLAQCYETLGQPSLALEHFKQYHTLKEKLQGAEQAHKFRALQVIHQTESAQREAELEREKNRELQQYVGQLQQLNEYITQLSLRDPLTNLYNRRHLMEIGEKMLEESKRAHLPFATVILDIDHFKKINDTYGHKVGDQILIELSGLLRQWTRGSDVVARYGGEEFVLLLAETKLEQARVVCEKMRQKVEQHDWSGLCPNHSVTISLGICADLECHAWAEMLNIADQKLYMAKHAGRNQTCY